MKNVAELINLLQCLDRGTNQEVRILDADTGWRMKIASATVDKDGMMLIMPAGYGLDDYDNNFGKEPEAP